MFISTLIALIDGLQPKMDSYKRMGQCTKFSGMEADISRHVRIYRKTQYTEIASADIVQIEMKK